jgi:general secretion pathway protein G
MNCSRPPRRPRPGRRPGGFTLVELLVVILVLAILIGLLLPAIIGAMRTARTAAVGAEINQLAQALAAFKAKYGDYPPSRILLVENGNYAQWLNGAQSTAPVGPNDITWGQLAQRSVSALRKFFPRVALSTTGNVPGIGPANFYDFNGNSNPDTFYILSGHECLVFFLGGIPQQTSNGGYSMSGFGKDPTNPFSNNNGVGAVMYNPNRQPPLFEFAPNRLQIDPSKPAGWSSPGYVDSTGNALSATQASFYAYFSAYGNGAYDPNDMNYPETDVNSNFANRGFRVPYSVHVNAPNADPHISVSPGPNPYTAGQSVPNLGTTNPPLAASYLNPQSFQIISAGIDGQYGIGGEYDVDSTDPLTLDAVSFATFDLSYTQQANDGTIRVRERDNVTNFHNGKLQ